MICQNEDPVQKRGPLQKEIKAPLWKWRPSIKMNTSLQKQRTSTKINVHVVLAGLISQKFS